MKSIVVVQDTKQELFQLWWIVVDDLIRGIGSKVLSLKGRLEHLLRTDDV